MVETAAQLITLSVPSLQTVIKIREKVWIFVHRILRFVIWAVLFLLVLLTISWYRLRLSAFAYSLLLRSNSSGLSFRHIKFGRRKRRCPTEIYRDLQAPLSHTLFTLFSVLKKVGLNYRIQGILFTSYWITIVPIVFHFVLQKVLTHVKHVVQSSPAFCSCSKSRTWKISVQS